MLFGLIADRGKDGTDIEALAEGYVSVTPLQLDLTTYPALHVTSALDWKIFGQPRLEPARKNGKHRGE